MKTKPKKKLSNEALREIEFERFRKKYRIQVMEIPTLGTWQATIYGYSRYSERAGTKRLAVKKLASRLGLEGRSKI